MILIQILSNVIIFLAAVYSFQPPFYGENEGRGRGRVRIVMEQSDLQMAPGASRDILISIQTVAPNIQTPATGEA